MLTHVILVMALEPKRKLHLVISNKDSYLKLISLSMSIVKKQKFENLTSGDHANYSDRAIDLIR
jgi:hypothetical protein